MSSRPSMLATSRVRTRTRFPPSSRFRSSGRWRKSHELQLSAELWGTLGEMRMRNCSDCEDGVGSLQPNGLYVSYRFQTYYCAGADSFCAAALRTYKDIK